MFARIISALFLVATLFGCTTINPIVTLDAPENLKALVHEEGKIILTVWGAAWCPFCQAFDAEIPRLQEKYGADLRIIKVDSDKWPARAFGIPASSIPFFAISVNGTVVSMGNGSVEDVETVLEEALKILKDGDDGQAKGH